MIKYFCDFCKKEMEMVGPKLDTEIGATITKRIDPNSSNYRTEKVEHVCKDCNAKLIQSLNVLGLEVQEDGTKTQV